MTRKLLAVLFLLLAVAAGALTVVAMHDVAETYADPYGATFSTFGDFGIVVVVGLLLVAALGAVAAALAPASRRAVVLAVVGLLVVTLVAALAAEELGVRAKRAETAEPPGCGIANPVLAAEFRRIDHPGYFGGGTESRTSCSYALFVLDVETGLGVYRTLDDLGYDVAVTDRGVTATGGPFVLTVRVRTPSGGDPFLQVGLRQVRPRQ